ncbi:MAG: glutamate racemase [Ferruginibacter sp.]|nr:glutamate racemase [Cytophagales bacterium]
MRSSHPIGIFDSGIGGLTVAHAITRRLPHENILYFGDTAHLPYGDKSAAAIQAYAVKICNLLIQQECKLILIACNSASAAAFELVREYVGSKAKVMNVIDPVIDYLGEHYARHTIGLIGTKQTVNSNVYRKKTDALEKGIVLHSLATPLLAPMIEEGFFNKNISQAIVNEYLSDESLRGIEALILACTHYPLIKAQINAYYGGGVAVIDSSEIVAQSLQGYLTEHHLLNRQGLVSNEVSNEATSEGLPRRQFFVSDYTRSFEASTRIFFGEQVRLEHYPLWE